MVLKSKSHLNCQEISTSVHRSLAAARSTCKFFMDTTAVQFSSVRIAAVVAWPSRNSQASTKLSRVSRTNRNETKKRCYKQALSQSVESYLYSLQTSLVLHGSCLIMCLASACDSVLVKCHLSLYQLTTLCQSAGVLGSSEKLQHTTRRFLGAFLSIESWQMELNYAV